MNSRAVTLSLLCIAILVSAQRATLAQQSIAPPVLALNQPLERELGGGQLHKFTLPVIGDQFVRIVARQQGVDIVLALRHSTGKTLVNRHNQFGGLTGVETIAVITSEAGNHAVEVGMVTKTAAAGCTEIFNAASAAALSVTSNLPRTS